MRQDDGSGADWSEDIQGAPPALSRSELRQRRQTETITVNRYLYQQVQQLEHMLLAACDLEAVLEVLLVSLPRHFSFTVCELWLYDPDRVLRTLITSRHRYGRNLILLDDVFDLQELYDPDPDVMLIDATDSRMFEILKSEYGVNYARMMPLLESGRLVGSLHWGLSDAPMTVSAPERDLFSHLGSIISICFQNAVSRQQLASLSLLDPQTELVNRRGFEIDLAREIARARRSRSPLGLILLDMDAHADLQHLHGAARQSNVVKTIAERIATGLRGTDCLARLDEARLAVVLPDVDEVEGREVAERFRQDLENFAIDGGRGAVVHSTMSIGLCVWEPAAYPAVDMRQLAKQLENAAVQGLQRAQEAGGNRVALSRLRTLLI